MQEKRAQIMHRALLDKVGNGIEMFTSDDILIVAGIGEAEIKAFVQSIEREINQLSLSDSGGA